MGTALLAGPLRAALVRSSALDVPNHRSSHKRPVPRSGGLAPLVTASLSASVARNRPTRKTAVAIVGLSAVGLADDLVGHVPSTGRLAAQFAAGTLLAETGSRRLLGGVVTTGVVNVTNFMDGINGISGLTAAVWGVHAMTAPGVSPETKSLGALIAGGGLGFLPHNAPRARLFLGDVGSYALGAGMAAGIVSRSGLKEQFTLAAPLLLYACDAAQALLYRSRAGLPIGVAHRDHVYQRLVDSGAPHLPVALFHAGMASLVAAAARRPTPARLGLITTICGSYLASPSIVGRWLPKRSPEAADESREMP